MSFVPPHLITTVNRSASPMDTSITEIQPGQPSMCLLIQCVSQYIL